MKKRILVVVASLVLLVGLACAVFADNVHVTMKDGFYRYGRIFDGFHAYCFPGCPGGVALTSNAINDADTYYDENYLWLNSFNVSLNDVDVYRSWNFGVQYFPESGSIGTFEIVEHSFCLFYNLRMASSPDYHVRFFIQGFPSWVWGNIEFFTASYSGSGDSDGWQNRYYHLTPFTFTRLSEYSLFTYGMSEMDGSHFSFDPSVARGEGAEDIYVIDFDLNGAVDVYGFVIYIHNVMDVTYTDYGDIDGGWFDAFGDVFSSFPSVLGGMFKYFFTIPFIGSLAVISGIFVFVCAVKHWSA